MTAASYDPFSPGPSRVGSLTFAARDVSRDRLFPLDVWFPAGATGAVPLVAFSHSSGPPGRRQSTFLCDHLASHGYVVAALDHSERLVPALMRPQSEAPEARSRRIQSWIDNRVPDIRFLLDFLLEGGAPAGLPPIDRERVGVAGHSFGGWTALAVPEVESRIRSIVAMAPAGSSNPPPGIIPATLTFDWGRDVPTLYIVAEHDSALPLEGMHELHARTRATRRMAILARADHGHFADAFDEQPGQRPRQDAHRLVRGLALAHLDATLRGEPGADDFFPHGVFTL